MHQARSETFRVLQASSVVLVVLCVLGSATEAKEVSIPIQIVVSHIDDATASWQAMTPDIQDFAPELNAGDSLKILRVENLTKDLGTWERTYKRFDHESCHTSWFRKKCDRYYAHDTFSRTKSFDVPGKDVTLTVEFKNGFAPTVGWKPGEFPVASFIDKSIPIPGPLEMTIEGTVGADVPQVMDGAVGDPEGPVRLKSLLGKDGPVVWFNLVVDFTAAKIVN